MSKLFKIVLGFLKKYWRESSIVILVLLLWTMNSLYKVQRFEAERWMDNYTSIQGDYQEIKKKNEVYVTRAVELSLKNKEIKRKNDSIVKEVKEKLSVLDKKYRNVYELYLTTLQSSNSFDIPKKDTVIIVDGDTLRIQYGVRETETEKLEVFNLFDRFKINRETELELTIVKSEERDCPEKKLWRWTCKVPLLNLIYKEDVVYDAFVNDTSYKVTKFKVIDNVDKN